MITAQELATFAPAAYAGAPHVPPQAVPLTTRILHAALFIAIFTSFVAFVEPSPHDLMVMALALACLIAGVTFDRNVLPLFLLLMLWNISGLVSLFHIASNSKALQYAGVSFYLAIAAVMFACLLAHDSERRIGVLRAAYILAALCAACAGIAGYFRLVPGGLFTEYGRASGTFKDPNVYAPFLILPLLFMIEPMISRRIKIKDLAIALVLLVGLFLSFSRGAWLHFAISAAVMVMIQFVAAATQRARMRIVMLSLLAVAGILVLLVVLTSIGNVAAMLQERAQAVQSYDVGEGGRFRLQQLALGALLDAPLGLGPFEFGRIYGLQQHNVYLQAFVVYGWVGGLAYVTMVLLTLMWGLRAALVRTPWQPYLSAAYGAFVGEAAEGFVIDTDHWRHFFLILGIVWGLSAATIKHSRIQSGLVAPA